MLQNIGIEKAWTCKHSRNENEPNAGNKNLFCIKWMQRCHFWCGYKIQIQIFNWQISPGLTKPINRVASTTAFMKFTFMKLKIFNFIFGYKQIKQINAKFVTSEVKSITLEKTIKATKNWKSRFHSWSPGPEAYLNMLEPQITGPT